MKRWITYFVQESLSKAVKIGRTFEGSSRIKDIQMCNPNVLKVIAVLRGNVERELHRRLARHRIHGEWFRAHAEVLAAADAGEAFWTKDGRLYLSSAPTNGTEAPSRAFTRPLLRSHLAIQGKHSAVMRMLGVINAVIGDPGYFPRKNVTSLALDRLKRLGFIVEAANGTHWVTLKATAGIPQHELSLNTREQHEQMKAARKAMVTLKATGGIPESELDGED